MSSSDSLLRPSYRLAPGARFAHVIFGPVPGGEQGYLYCPDWSTAMPSSVARHLGPLLLVLGGQQQRQPVLAFANLSQSQDLPPEQRTVGWLLSLPLRKTPPGERPQPALRYALVAPVTEFGVTAEQLAASARALLEALVEAAEGEDSPFEAAYHEFVLAYRANRADRVLALWVRLRERVEAVLARLPEAEPFASADDRPLLGAEDVRDLHFVGVTLPARYALADLVWPLAVASAVLCRSRRRWTAVSSGDERPEGGGLYLRVACHAFPASSGPPPRELPPAVLSDERRCVEALDPASREASPGPPGALLPVVPAHPTVLSRAPLAPPAQQERWPEAPATSGHPSPAALWLLHGEIFLVILLLGGILWELHTGHPRGRPEGGAVPLAPAAAAAPALSTPPDLGAAALGEPEPRRAAPDSKSECASDRKLVGDLDKQLRLIKHDLDACKKSAKNLTDERKFWEEKYQNLLSAHNALCKKAKEPCWPTGKSPTSMPTVPPANAQPKTQPPPPVNSAASSGSGKPADQKLEGPPPSKQTGKEVRGNAQR